MWKVWTSCHMQRTVEDSRVTCPTVGEQAQGQRTHPAQTGGELAGAMFASSSVSHPLTQTLTHPTLSHTRPFPLPLLPSPPPHTSPRTSKVITIMN
jgi:hypothetical protein